MSYLHIFNLYKDQTILLFRECWAMEKVDGTSAHIAWRDDNAVHYSHGGGSAVNFRKLFDDERLKLAFAEIGHPTVTVYGEFYGGSIQGLSHRYGKESCFVAFEVNVGGVWLAVPQAADVAKKLGIEFVHYERIPTDLASIDAQRDAPSVQAKRNGVEGEHRREGVVLRPLVEFVANNGDRVIAKHKRDEERETVKTRPVVDPAKMEVLTKASAIADDWVTPKRLEHVLDKLPEATGMEHVPAVIRAMVEDVLREGAGEIVDSREARAAIGRKAAELFKAHLQKRFIDAAGRQS